MSTTADLLIPQSLLLVRHGQSAGNIARDQAEANGLGSIDIEWRDVDVPLSPLGEEQAQAIGKWIGQLPSQERPTLILTSPYIRARQTAEIAARFLPERDKTRIVIDERLREREFGIIDRLTRTGVIERYPDQAELYTRLKKFYYRPPGGESWCDVILRLRSMLDTISREHAQERILIFCHTVVVYCFRYLIEKMTEEEILGIDKKNDLANCSLTAYELDRSKGRSGELILKTFNFTAPLEEEGAAITRKPDVPGGPK